MKKLVFAIAALAALSLLAPTSGFAQFTAHNQIGIYTDAVGTSPYVEGVDNLSTVTGYVLATMPYDENGGAAAVSISGFEVGVTMPGTAVLTATTFPNATSLNVGGNDNMIVGIGTPSQVIDNMVHLATLSMLYVGGGAPAEVLLKPSEPASVAGAMVLVVGDATIMPAYPSSGDYASPVFGINTQVTATEESTFDNIKAMYR